MLPLLSSAFSTHNVTLPWLTHKQIMAAASMRSFFSTFLLFLLHLGCFIFSSSNHRKRKSSPQPHSRLKLKTNPFSTSWSFLKRLFSSKLTDTGAVHHNRSIPSPSSSTRSSLHRPTIISLIKPDDLIYHHPIKRSFRNSDSDITSDQFFFPLRNDIYPCTLCGEVFQNTAYLDQHQSITHAVSELTDGDSGRNIVEIIFKTGWPENAFKLTVHRILKIHNSPKILTRFEEYRECVKSKAAMKNRDERCIADGNELLRFHCATFMCELGQNGNSNICSQQYCSVCGIINSGFSCKMDGISTQPTSWKAHMAIPEGIEEEFGFMHVKRAVLVCRVIAGRIGCDPDLVDKQDPGFDSLVGRESGVHTRLDEDDELLVFNPRALLPCFVIVYSTV